MRSIQTIILFVFILFIFSCKKTDNANPAKQSQNPGNVAIKAGGLTAPTFQPADIYAGSLYFNSVYNNFGGTGLAFMRKDTTAGSFIFSVSRPSTMGLVFTANLFSYVLDPSTIAYLSPDLSAHISFSFTTNASNMYSAVDTVSNGLFRAWFRNDSLFMLYTHTKNGPFCTSQFLDTNYFAGKFKVSVD